MNLDEMRTRVNQIINSKTKVEYRNDIPKEQFFTYENGVKGWVTSIFIDMVNSSEIFKEENDENLARILRAFTAESISIMDNDNARQVGIRGDCVYAIYSTPNKSDIYDVFKVAIELNTFVKKVLTPSISNTKFKDIQFGIGCASSKCLVIKAGKKSTGINDTIWIGDAVVDAANLSGIANHKKSDYSTSKYKNIALNDVFYSNMIEADKLKNVYKVEWFEQDKVIFGKKHESVYLCDLSY
jgi:hypothetical protein